ncbi:MAG: DUF459 domain-containing protein [Alphaproteobacteria bacterium]|nr:DUF459 domain-containing protein [Alphaproteobacteria bacterium]
MTTADKYRPVSLDFPRTTPILPVYLGALAVAGLLALWCGDTLRREAVYDEDLPAAARAVLTAVADLGEATGLAAGRRALDDWTAPLDDTTKLLAMPLYLPPDEPEPEAAPPEPDVPPGERWQAVARKDLVRRVLIVGASSIQYAVGTELERELGERFDVVVVRKGKVATGLSRPDVFDWPAETARLCAEARPQLVVGQFGGNDGQNLLDAQGRPLSLHTPEWEAEYARRIGQLAQVVRDCGARLLLVGMPIMRSDAFSRKIRWLNDVTREAVTAEGGLYVDIFDTAATAEGTYRTDVTVDGRTGRMRTDDGIHFTRLGGIHVARILATRLARTVVLPPRAPEPADSDTPAAPTPAAAWRLEVPASDRRAASPFLAFVPPDVPPEGLPVWYLLHGAWDDWTAWSEHAHDLVARLAAQERVIVVLPDGEPFGYWLDAPRDPTHRIASWFWADLVPFAERTLPANGRRALSGVSMGGHGALWLALQHPDRVAAATSISGAVDLRRSRVDQLAAWLGPQAEAPEVWRQHSLLARLEQTPHALDGVRLHLSVAEDDRWWAEANAELHAVLTEAGVAHGWSTVPHGGHTWEVWTEALPAHAAVVGEALATP